MSGTFTPDEDAKLKELINEYGDKNFSLISRQMPHRGVRELRRRYANFLKGSINDTSWSPQENDLLKEMYKKYGAKWGKISNFFKQRSPSSIRNRHHKITKDQEDREEKLVDDILPVNNFQDQSICPCFPTNENETISQNNQGCQLGSLPIQTDRLIVLDYVKFEGLTGCGIKVEIPQTMHGLRFVEILGSGAFSLVALAIDESSSKKFAAKIIPKDPLRGTKEFDTITREIGFLKYANHDNIVKYHKHFCTDDDKYLIIIMDYCEQDLFSYIFENKDDFKALKKILSEIVSAVQYLHHKHIAHLDLKPENILIKDGRPLICDFGFSNFHLVRRFDFVKHGTPIFAGPESYSAAPVKVDAFKVDIYALGLIFYLCATQDSTLYSNNSYWTYRRINYGLEFDESDELQKLAKECTAHDPKYRPTIDEILSHSYFNF